MKKGFTLIELLAVIVILAIIALIATPIILNIISDAKKESNKRSIEMYGNAVKNAVAKYQLNNNESISGTFTSSEDGKTLTKGDTTLKVEYNGNVKCETTKIYEDGSVYLADCKVDGKEVEGYIYGTMAFAEDSWETIATNVESGNLSKYLVGDTKEVAITGYTNGEANSNGLYTVRIANTSTPEECNQAGFSQSACGFVIEFVDIITTHNMNRTYTDVGGWPASDMYKFLNDTTDSTITSIYESLSEDLQQVIKPTQVVSSHGESDSTNFTSTDKLYLLSTKEVWGTSKQYDTTRLTRQLDYYKNLGVTTSNYSGAIKKYNGSATEWWLRSAYSNDDHIFFGVTIYGDSRNVYAAPYTGGVAPAFRIG